MSRNVKRIRKPSEPPIQSAPEQPLTYSPPTTHVSLPSGGAFYPPEHPLHGEDAIEVKHMTTREEEILTSPTLMKTGLVVDRLIESVVVNKRITPESLLLGDKNAILVGLRIDAYGEEYEIEVNCPTCTSTRSPRIDLTTLGTVGEGESTANGTFLVELPRTGAKVELRPLTGKDEKELAKTAKKHQKYGLADRHLTLQYQLMIVSVNGDSNPLAITSFVENLPAFDSRELRKAYKKINPDVDMRFNFQCDICSHEQVMEVPITANFFWSD